MFAFLMNGIPFGTSFMYGGEYVITIYNNNMRRFLLFCMLFTSTVLNVKARLQLIDGNSMVQDFSTSVMSALGNKGHDGSQNETLSMDFKWVT